MNGNLRIDPSVQLFDAQGRINLNAFCPTGEGGGVDPHCSPGGADHFLKTWHAGPSSSPDFWKHAESMLQGMSPKELKQVAAGLKTDRGGWSNIKPSPKAILAAVHDRWGSYHRASI